MATAQETADSLHHLNDSVYQLENVEISALRKRHALEATALGKLDFDINRLQSLPKFLGTVDLFRTMQLTPGVQTGGEMNTGLYVRGCESGHNLVLLDGAPIYNPIHLLGFFSMLNADHIATTSLQKSYLPSQYGGRLAATVDINTRDTQAERFEIKGNVGLIASNVHLGTPIGNKSTLRLSGRATYINPILRLINTEAGGITPAYGFQDYNLTFSSRPTAKSGLKLNLFFGSDNLSIKEHFYQVNGGIRWQNIAASAQWTQHLPSNTRMKHTAYYTYYNNTIDAELGGSIVRLPSRIQEAGYKSMFHFRMGAIYWTVGAAYAYHAVDPQYPAIADLFSIGATSQPPRMHTNEFGVFAQADLPLTDLWTLRMGLRYGGTAYQATRQRTTASGTASPGKLGFVSGKGKWRTEHGFEPRLASEFSPSACAKISAAYTLQRQYICQVAVSGVGLPTDFWLPASDNVPSQYAHSASIGYSQVFGTSGYELSVEGYYKRLRNQLESNGEMYDMVNKTYHVGENLLYGHGKSYGAELMIRKNLGKLTGWISYTIGRSTRTFAAINEGKPFAAKNDRRHDLSVVASYALNKRWDISAVFVYATGNAFTMPTALYLVGENAINEYGPHNGTRMPPYHRLDLSATYYFKRSARWESALNISLYNAYMRKNPLFLTVKVKPTNDAGDLSIRPKGQSLYSLVPSISYSFKF